MKRTPSPFQLVSGVALAVLITAGSAGAAFAGWASDPVSMPALIAVERDGDRPLWVQPHEVTVAEWNLCHTARGCSQQLRTPDGRHPDITPATNLSHMDVMEYIAWISDQTGHDFRLPSSAEWESLAAGIVPDVPDPIFTDPALRWASTYLREEDSPRELRRTGAFSTSRDGIADLDGSVWEWTQDCATDATPDRCPAFYVGGLHMAVVPFLERDPARGGCAIGAPPAHLGLRLVSDSAPSS
ncbi:formylglycine-generating enzyme family protein [Oceaniglobus ichthyenteri]|uniref:formylglycine-generating enzyme family protein n=1 Tax=Oceaniglobus ichthyenteri TaxID=2136177 RepID=UPI000D38A997|nr:SUMF1/EgtB/PvdO family nonheme iron enzyme [Oceaniglobus ichthyenteri]